MASLRWQPLVLVLAICALAELVQGGGKTLVLLDEHSIAYTHSNFFDSLKKRGFDLEFATADNAGLSLTRYGEYLYKNLIIFAPSVTEFGGSVDVEAITNFIDNGGNVLVAASSAIDQGIRDLATECGLEFDETKTSVIDHANYDVADSGSHTRILVNPNNIINSTLIVGAKSSAPLLYRGVGMAIDPDNQLVMSLVHGASTAYSYYLDDKITEYPHAIGESTVLVAALQARNNARVVFSGSLDLFSDEFMTSSIQGVAPGSKRFDRAANQEFVEALSRWVFKETGVLRYSDVQHHHAGEKTTPSFYYIEENVEYSIFIEEYVNDKWQPFNGDGVQLEFHRIDPFVRTPLQGNRGVYSVKFQLPDVYGVFQFKVDYRSLGYTYLFSTTQISVRPKTHVQYERFIPCAFPYYASALSMMAGLVLFSAVFLFHRDSKQKQN